MSIPDSYKRNSGFYNKNGRARGGFFTAKAATSIPKENFEDRDIGNRNAVVNEIVKLIENGMTLEEACKQVAAKPEVINNFKYFARESLPQIFENWYNGKMRERKPIEKGER